MLAAVEMKQRTYHRAAGRVRPRKDVQTAARSRPIPSSAPGKMKDNVSETGSETERTLTGAETSRDITGTETGVRSAKVTPSVIGTGGTIEINTTTARTETVPHTLTHTGTGTRSAAGRGLRSTLTGTVTTSGHTIHTTTAPGTTGAGIGGATVTTTRMKLTITGSGRRRDEIPWPRRTRATAETGTVSRPLQLWQQKRPQQQRTRPLGIGPLRLDPLQMGRITGIGKNMLVRRAIARKNTKRARRKRSQRIKTDTVTAGESFSSGNPTFATYSESVDGKPGFCKEYHCRVNFQNSVKFISNLPHSCQKTRSSPNIASFCLLIVISFLKSFLSEVLIMGFGTVMENHFSW